MKTRIFQTRFWNDDQVITVTKDATLLWNFLLTNEYLGMTNYVKITDNFLCYYTKLTPIELTGAKIGLEKTGKVRFHDDWIWIKNLERENGYMRSPLNKSSYEKELTHVPEAVRAFFERSNTTTNSTTNTNQNKKPEIRNKNTKTVNKKSKIRNKKEPVKKSEKTGKQKYDLWTKRVKGRPMVRNRKR